MANLRRHIKMDADEVLQYLARAHGASVATVGRTGMPHLAAMNIALFEGALVMTTHVKSQKSVNLHRNPAIAVLVQDGNTYANYAGVLVTGHAELIDDAVRVAEYIQAVSRSSGSMAPDSKSVSDLAVGRIGIRLVVPTEVVSWDHRKMNA
jgi:nitroimidazol reductase NimA-like FMN-containing flavoprotein (pyridoxamine 5'-phosphate oxidase superfamily)